jgi:hypothetical protein
MGWKPHLWDHSETWFDHRLKAIIEKGLACLSLHTIANGLEFLNTSNNQLDASKPLGRLISHMFCGGPFKWSISDEPESFVVTQKSVREVWPSGLNSLEIFLSLGIRESMYDLSSQRESIKQSPVPDPEVITFLARNNHLPSNIAHCGT